MYQLASAEVNHQMLQARRARADALLEASEPVPGNPHNPH